MGRREGRGGTERGKDRRGNNEENCPALLGGTMGREKGHSRKLDSLSPSTRDRGAPEWGKEQRGRRKHEDISWFVRIVRTGEEGGGESARVTQSLTWCGGRHYVRVVNNSRLDFFQHVYFLPAAAPANRKEGGGRRRRWSGDPRPPSGDTGNREEGDCRASGPDRGSAEGIVCPG